MQLRVSVATMRRTFFLSLLFLISLVGSVLAQPRDRRAPRPPPRADVWDSRGWTMLGEQAVQGRVDRDRINVGRYEGRFSKLTVVVLDSDLELLDFSITFADRTTYDPKLAHYFRENQRTRVFDLPGAERVIQHIDLKYRNLPGGGRARVQVWGFKTADLPPPPPPRPIEVRWDSRGWTLLGEQTVQGRVDRDRITLGRYVGTFSKVTVVVLDSDLEMLAFTLTFADNSTYDPRLAHYFREGQRTRAFDLPRGDRIINQIDLKYRNLPGGGRARVQVWGLKTGATAVAPPPPPPPRPVVVNWDSRGWTLLGERELNGRVDRDRIDVGRHEGRFSKLTIVALDSDLELIDFEVTFGRGTSWRPSVAHYFREGQRTRAVDFPNGDDRPIKHIDFKYRNLPGGGRAKLQVWGFKTEVPRGGGGRGGYSGTGWDNRDWVMLGEQTVQGRVDRDRIVIGRDEGRFSKLMIVVLDSELELLDFDVQFRRGQSWRPAVAQVFNEGARTRAIDLPGDRRVIRHIDVKYRNLPGGGRARIQVWGK